MDLHIKLGHISLNYLDKIIKNTTGYNNIMKAITNKERNTAQGTR